MIARIRRTIPLALGLLALASTGSRVMAQGNDFNPYGNSGYADYREFGKPVERDFAATPTMPRQALLDNEPLIGRPRANSFREYVDELNGNQSGPGAGGRALPGETYYQAYQRMNSRNNRVYRSNNTKANDEFERRQRERDALYARALQERDPAKRAQLMRQVQQDSIDRPAATARPRAAAGTTGTPSSRVAPAPAPAPTGRAPSPFPSSSARAGGERRTPSPFATTRPPSTSAPATRRAPSPYRAPAPESTRPRADSTGGPEPATRPAPDPSTIPIPPPR